jgi:hypothetical protein
MKELLLQALTLAYGGVGIIAFIAYFPTIKDIYYNKKACANISSYVLWTVTGCISFLYSLFILPDLLFRFVTGLNLIACMIVLILSIKLKNDR